MLRAPFHGIFIYAGNQTATSKPTDIIRPYEMLHTHHFPLCYRQTNNKGCPPDKSHTDSPHFQSCETVFIRSGPPEHTRAS